MHFSSPIHFGAGNITDDLVAVTDAGVTLLAAAAPATGGAKRARVILQNLGDKKVFVRLGAAASNTGANGEYVLKAGTAAGDGTGGTLDLTGIQAAIYGACITEETANVSVTVFNY
jgi:hypothetical protein